MEIKGFWPQTAEGLIGLLITVASAVSATYFSMKKALTPRLKIMREAFDTHVANEIRERQKLSDSINSIIDRERQSREKRLAEFKLGHEELRREMQTTFGTFGGRSDISFSELKNQISKLQETVNALNVNVAELRTEVRIRNEET